MVPWTKEIPKELKICYCTFQFKKHLGRKTFKVFKEVLGEFFWSDEDYHLVGEDYSSNLFKYYIKLVLKYGCWIVCRFGKNVNLFDVLSSG